tara:strand:- start:389 stop:628 length:240 start_codon:yes stop_codon:yes gene_type:complete
MMNPVSAMRLLTIALMASTTAFGQTTVIKSGTKTQWKFLDNSSDGGSKWRTKIFNDSKLTTGPATLGYGERGLCTSIAA